MLFIIRPHFFHFIFHIFSLFPPLWFLPSLVFILPSLHSDEQSHLLFPSYWSCSCPSDLSISHFNPQCLCTLFLPGSPYVLRIQAPPRNYCLPLPIRPTSFSRLIPPLLVYPLSHLILVTNFIYLLLFFLLTCSMSTLLSCSCFTLYSCLVELTQSSFELTWFTLLFTSSSTFSRTSSPLLPCAADPPYSPRTHSPTRLSAEVAESDA